MKEILSLFSQSIIYSLGNVATIAAGFLLLPLYTRYLLPHEYGVVEMLNIFLQIAGIILALGMGSAIFKCYYFDCKEEEERKELLGTAFIFLLLFCALSSSILLFFSSSLSRLLIGKEGYKECFSLTVWTNFFRTLLLLPLALYRAQEKARNYVACILFQLFLNIALNAFFLIHLRWGIHGIWRGNMLSSCITTFFCIGAIKRYIKFKLRKSFLIQLLSFGIPIMPTSIFGWIMTVADRYFLQHFCTLHEVGLYAVGYKIGMLTQILFVFPFSLAWPPFIMKVVKEHKEEDAKHIFSKVFFYFTIFLLSTTFLLSIYSHEAISFIATPIYIEAATIVPIVLLCYLLNAWYLCFCVGMNVRAKVKYFLMLSLVGALSNLFFNWWLIPLYGMEGAAFATLLSYILMAILSYVLSQRLYRITYPFLKVFFIFALCFLMYSIGVSFPFLQKTLFACAGFGAIIFFLLRWERLRIY